MRIYFLSHLHKSLLTLLPREFLSSAVFFSFKINFYEKFFRNTISVKYFGSRSGPTFDLVPNCLHKSYQQTTLGDRELNAAYLRIVGHPEHEKKSVGIFEYILASMF